MSSLNPMQQRAVDAPTGPMLVVACAGSGKTRVLTRRVLSLIERGAQPERILLLTFTRRAAREMLERAANVHESAKRVDGGTFHSFAMRMVSAYHQDLHLPRRPTVIDTDDAANAVAAVVESLNIDNSKGRLPAKRALQELFSLAVNKGISTEQALEELYPQFLERIDEIKAIRAAYAKYKLQNAYVDFDDLLVLLLALLKNPLTRKRIQNRYDHILVDEFQDTNHLQGEIALALAERHQSVMVVGDDAQSIYGWRGAKVGNILEFPKQFPSCEVINLEDNYRSTQAILDTANAVLLDMQDAFSKTMRAAAAGAGEKPRLHVFEDAQHEAEYIADRLQEAIDAGEGLSEIAVLYRNNFLSLPLQAELTKRKIPFIVQGGIKITDAAHVKDLLSYLRVLHNPFDELAWMRMLQLLPRIGAQTATKLYRAATATDAIVVDGPRDPIKRLAQVQEQLPGKTAYREALAALATALQEAVAGATPLEMYDRALKHYAELAAEKYDNFRDRLEDLDFLRTVIARYRSLASLLDDLTLDPITGKTQAAGDEEKWDVDAVTLSTIHSSKGLEWKHVYLTGVADGTLPSYRALSSADPDGKGEGLEEEKRLLYVAITRAKHHLDICYAIFGRPGHGVMQDLSRFLSTDAVTATIERIEHVVEQPISEDDVLLAMSGGLIE